MPDPVPYEILPDGDQVSVTFRAPRPGAALTDVIEVRLSPRQAAHLIENLSAALGEILALLEPTEGPPDA